MPKYKKGKKKTGGRRSGVKNKKTIEIDQALELYQQAILKELQPLMDSQFAVAKGTQIVVARDKIWDEKKKKKIRKGRFVRLTITKEILEVLNSDGEGEDYYIIFSKDPNPRALEHLMTRVFGRPQENIDITTLGKAIKGFGYVKPGNTGNKTDN